MEGNTYIVPQARLGQPPAVCSTNGMDFWSGIRFKADERLGVRVRDAAAACSGCARWRRRGTCSGECEVEAARESDVRGGIVCRQVRGGGGRGSGVRCGGLPAAGRVKSICFR